MTIAPEPIARLEDLRPGDIGLGPIHGLAGAAVGLGQLLLGEGWALKGDHQVKIRHACIVIRSSVIGDPYPWYVEAMSAGARQATGDRWTQDWAWVRLPEDYSGQGADAAHVARRMVEFKVPYSPASYLALAAWRAHLPVPHLERWIDRRRKASTFWLPSGGKTAADLPEEAICSVLVDQCWTLAGKKIMQGVPHQCVTPAALAHRLRFGTPGAVWGFPGR